MNINDDNELVGLIGPNGAGKSTLMSMICSIVKPTAGEILYNGVNIYNSGMLSDYRSKIAFVPQKSLYTNI